MLSARGRAAEQMCFRPKESGHPPVLLLVVTPGAHHGFIETLLTAPPSELLPYRRLRISRYLDAIDGDDLCEQYELCNLAIDNKWGYGRAVAWVLAGRLCRGEVWQKLKMIMYQQKLFSLSDEEYKTVTSDMRKEWKLNGRMNATEKQDHAEITDYLYLHNLIGRGK